MADDHPQAAEVFERASAGYLRAGDLAGAARTIRRAAMSTYIFYGQDEAEMIVEAYEQAAEVIRSTGVKDELAQILYDQGRALNWLDLREPAEAAARESLELYTALDAEWGVIESRDLLESILEPD